MKEYTLEAYVQDFLKRTGLTLNTTHYKTHAAELDPDYVARALDSLISKGVVDGSHEIKIKGFKGKTRLWGAKMGDTLGSETTYLISRGEGRPLQDRIICRDSPFRSTDIITIVIRGGGLETLYAGPALGEMPTPGEKNNDWETWRHHALAYSPSELRSLLK